MPTAHPPIRLVSFVFLAAIASQITTGCVGLSPQESAAVVVGGITASTLLGGQAPNNEIEQTYYLGIFDPQDQLPPTVYRVRVHGQASFISRTKFASGWVPANVLDALGSSTTLEKEGVKIEKADAEFKTFRTGRRLVLFGPEGFREAPANHRLVILMGSSPEAFFQAIDESLGVVAQVTQERGSVELERFLFETLVIVRNERTQIDQLTQNIKADLPVPNGAR